LWLAFFVIGLACASLCTVVSHVKHRLDLIQELNGITSYRRAWESLGISQKLDFFNVWMIILMLGNFFQILGGLLTLIDQNSTLGVDEIIIGFGCFFAWIGVVKFFTHSSHSYTLINTLKITFPIIGPYIVGVIPIFMAYALLGLCVFWKTGIYYSVTMSILANFALLNGDSVFLFSFAGYQASNLIGQAYYFTFIVFFIW
jgi:hypothetical protein